VRGPTWLGCAQHGACGQTPDGPSRLAPGLGAFFAPPASRASGRPSLRLRGGSRPKDGGQGDASQEETLAGWSPEEDATKEAKEAWAETRCSALLLCTSLPASTPAALGIAACVCGRVIYGCLVSQSVAEADRGGGAENGPRPSRLDAKHYRLGEVPPASQVTALLLTDTNDINNLDNTMSSYDICNDMNINFWNEIYNDLNINFWNGCLGFFDARFGGKRKKTITPP